MANEAAPPVDRPQGSTLAKTARRVAVIALALCAVMVAVIIVFRPRTDRTDDAYVTGHVHVISARVTGVVTEVLVDDNQPVKAGDLLVRLDAEDFFARQRTSAAQIAQARAQVSAADSQADQARASVASTAATAVLAALDFQRARELIDLSPRGISQQDFDAARATLDSANAAVRGARAQVGLAKANREAATALQLTGDADLRDADLQVKYTEIRAPLDGRIGRKTVEVGTRVNAGQSLLALVEEDIWIVANFKETQLVAARPGALVDVSIDAIPHRLLRGHVDSVSPASGAQFALLPPDNATGNFTKVVQRVPVKIRIEQDDLNEFRSLLTPGLSAYVAFKESTGVATRAAP